MEPDFFRRLIAEGKRMGAHVFLFGPQDVMPAERKIRGFTPCANGWKSEQYGWPDIVIDHYRYYPVPKHKHYLPFRKKEWLRYANNRFTNKFRVHQILEQDAVIHKWLPHTADYSREALSDMLDKHRVVYLKPTTGTGGRSILRMERANRGFLLHGRTKELRKSTLKLGTIEALSKLVESWMAREKRGREQFFLQQGLNLSLVPGRTVDARILVQKDGTGEWSITGMGMRIGSLQSSTSNLHSGGRAVPCGKFLTRVFGESRASAIMEECKELALLAVTRVEEHFGQMIEFGIDVGIDVSGRVWLIEMNPKPGREIFRQLGQMDRYLLAVRRPLEYALYLLDADDRK